MLVMREESAKKYIAGAPMIRKEHWIRLIAALGSCIVANTHSAARTYLEASPKADSKPEIANRNTEFHAFCTLVARQR